MTEFLPRSSWTDDPYPGGATLLVPGEVLGLAVHWPGGSGSVPTLRSASIQILNGELRFHTDPVSAGGRGYSDIAYNWAVDQEGRVWDLRGWQRRSGANGDTEVNRQYLAATCLIGPKDIPSPALLQALRDLRNQVVLRRYPKATRVVPHSAIRPAPTDCPGDRLRAHIAAGTFTSTAAIQEDDVTPEDLKAIENLLTKTVVWDKDNEPDPALRSASLTAIGVVAARHAFNAENLARALAGKVDSLGAVVAALAAAAPDVDELALAAHLAPLLAAVLPDHLDRFSDDELERIATAVNDLKDARERARLGPGS